MAELTTEQRRKNAKDREAEKAEQSRRNWAALMSTQAGRMIMFELLDEFCGLYSASYDENPGRMAYNEGQRSLGIILQGRLQTEHREMYLLMMTESLGRVPKVPPTHETDQDSEPTQE